MTHSFTHSVIAWAPGSASGTEPAEAGGEAVQALLDPRPALGSLVGRPASIRALVSTSALLAQGRGLPRKAHCLVWEVGRNTVKGYVRHRG